MTMTEMTDAELADRARLLRDRIMGLVSNRYLQAGDRGELTSLWEEARRRGWPNPWTPPQAALDLNHNNPKGDL